jgi:hypothetical protein
MARKTIQVEAFRTRINGMLAESTCSPAERGAMATILESVLMDTGNYRGYRYIDAVYTDQGVLVSGDPSRREYLR